MVSREMVQTPKEPYETSCSIEVSIGVLFRELRNVPRPGVTIPTGDGMTGFAQRMEDVPAQLFGQ